MSGLFVRTFTVFCVIAVLGASHAHAQTGRKLRDRLDEIQQSLDSLRTALDEIPPAWSRTLPAADRFALVMAGEAVLDRETGLVWERSPSPATLDWFSALSRCQNLEIGGRKGWHVPTVEQLASLIDTSIAASPKLPIGHPFTGMFNHENYRSSTTFYLNDYNIAFNWYVRFDDGTVGNRNKNTPISVWCVRGGQGHDQRTAPVVFP
jgi:hypothetical protein